MEWSLKCYLNGEEQTPLGVVRVEAEENTARIATFTILPPAESIDITYYIGKSATIDIIVDTVTTRIFNGKVNLPTYDPVTGLLQFDCSDNLQGYFETLTEAQILTAIPGGYYDESVFGERQDGWQQTLDVLSTVPSAVNLDADGTTLSVTSWYAKTTPDRTYFTADIVDASMQLEIGRLREIVNTINLSAEYRFSRLHHRERTYGWNWGVVSFCDWYLDTFPLPTRDMITSAATGAGWQVQNEAFVFETLPDSGTYTCGGGPVAWSITPEAQNQWATNATWTMVKRWSQTVTETYTITLQDAESVTKFGEIAEDQGVGFATEYGDASFDASIESETPTGWTTDNVGDLYEDQDDRAISDNGLLCMLNYCRTRILRAHRYNYVQFDVLIEPDLDLIETVRVDDSTVISQGKVYQMVHQLDIETGRALTTVKLAISKGGGGGTDTEITTVPTAPDTLVPGPVLPDSIVLLNHIGNDDAAPAYDETWTGLTTNWDLTRGTPAANQIYPIRMRVDTEAIEDFSRDETTGATVDSISIYAPDEELVTYGLGPLQDSDPWYWSATTFKHPDITLYAGNLGARHQIAVPTLRRVATEKDLPSTDSKWYWEVEVESIGGINAVQIGVHNWFSAGIEYGSDGNRYSAGGGTAYGNTYIAGDVISVAIHRVVSLGEWRIWFAKNGVWQASGDPENGTGYITLPFATTSTLKASAAIYDSEVLANFGVTNLAYPVPIGFQRLIYAVP